jgi:hypothetical protein
MSPSLPRSGWSIIQQQHVLDIVLSLGHNHSMNHLHLAASFLSGLGYQFSLLRHVAIDADSMCPAGCDGFQLDYEDKFDILPLVRVLWAHPSTSCRIYLTKTGRTVDRRILSPWFIDQGNRLPDRDVRLLEQIICAVGTLDNLDVQKYGRFERLIANIRVNKALNLVEVTFPSTGHDLYFDWQATTMTFRFHRTDQGGLCQLQKDDWKATDKLKNLPHNVSDKIQGYALTEQPVVFDRDRKTTQGFPYHLTQINHEFHCTTRSQFSLFNKVVAHMTTNATTTDFARWASLRYWLDNPISVLFSQRNFHMSRNDQNQSGPLPTIVLDLHCPTAMALSDLRINVTDLVRLTYHFQTLAMLSVQARSGFANIAHNHEFNFTVAEMRRKCFVFLGSIIDQQPERLQQDCPEIWINGKGSIIEAVYPSQNGAVQDIFSNPYAYANTTTTTAMGIYYARLLETRAK